MPEELLSAALEREHREIDRGIEAYVAGLDAGRPDPTPLRGSMTALRRHIYLEEEFLFPPLRQSGLMAPIFVMLREHGELWQTMDRIDAGLETNDSVDELCQELLGQLDAHNSKEEPVIYPQADAGLSPHATEQLLDFLEGAHTPDGWVCQGARN